MQAGAKAGTAPSEATWHDNTSMRKLISPPSLSPNSGVLMQEDGEAGTGSQEGSRHGLERRRSTPLLLHYAPLDFMEALSEGCAFNGQAITLADSELTARLHYLSPVKHASGQML